MNELKREELFLRLKNAENTEGVFMKIMRATSVQELIEYQLDPEEVIPLFHAAEELAEFEERNWIYGNVVFKKLKKARPSKRYRAFFI